MEAESVAENILQAEGATILMRRARTPCGEIDLVSQNGSHLTFTEVKQRATLDTALRSLSSRQRIRITRAAEILLARHPEWNYESMSFDLIAVDQTGAVTQIRNAFQAE